MPLSVNEQKKTGQMREVWHRLVRNKTAMVGLIVISLLILMSVFAPLIVSYDSVRETNAEEKYQPPSAEHPFGTDDMGRDYFARIVYGGRASLSIGFICVAVAMSIGLILGASAAYFSGAADSIIMRIMDVLSCIPSILLALVIVAALGPGLVNLIIAITISTVPTFTRVIRASVLPIVGQDFIEAARACGTRHPRIVLRHILPNAMGPIIVQATMALSQIIIAAAGLSFIGMGIQPPAPEWGAMLSNARTYIMTSPYLIIFPGIFIVLAALSLNLLGDGLRDALDPRLRD
ncbi:ABC transporter permease [Eubacteriales bacterium OttesenSCG-928-K08]|nr:ABC transporter permease [Eubacteriales bacterium OttesenSCG-928-K08]